MNETINDRIEMLINEHCDGNKAAFAKSIGLPPTGLSNYLGKQRRSKPSIDMIANIIQVFDVDARWLILGEKVQNVANVAKSGGVAFSGNNNSGNINAGGESARIIKSLELLVEQLKSQLEDKDKIIKLLER
jgi:hypothetical protein